MSSEQRAGMLQDYWERVLPLLVRMDGVAAADILIDLREKGDRDRNFLKVWNGLRNRITEWLEDYFAREPLSQSEEKAGLYKKTVGRVRLKSFLHQTYSGRETPDQWNSADLKYIFQVLRERAGPPTEERRHTN